MLKFFYRLKKRGGVVLFAVIAFMTLLITMASVAYFTARASFNTVVSNYDFSQMYISTTSVSDMLIEALSQDTSKAGAAVTDNLNYFKDLKIKVDDLISAVTLDPTKINTADATLIGVSGNVSYLDKDNTEKLLQDGSNNAVEPGVLDAVKSTIKIIKVDLNVAELGGRNKYYFTFTTVGYYRNNTITVQDTLYAVAGPKGTKGNKLFTTFFTATGQELSSGVVDETGR
ncbi:MAG: hypothetical protein K5876_01085, partial [Ruminiclostridium sp.]|nr:hypothetical protein [Ruminiclostridium sp.]